MKRQRKGMPVSTSSRTLAALRDALLSGELRIGKEAVES